MLKNKEQRQQFLEDNSNWTTIYQSDQIGLIILRIKFNDGTSILRFDEKHINEYVSKHPYWSTRGYRFLDNETGVMQYNDYSLSRVIEELKHKEIVSSR